MSLNAAINHARDNPIIKLPQMAALIYRRNSYISCGWNSYKSHPMAAKYGRHADAIYLHAEVAAILDAIRRGREQELRGAIIYIARVLKNGQPALAKPCGGCMGAISELGIENVIWTKN